MELFGPTTLQQLGPIGVLALLSFFLYLRLGPRSDRQHLENSQKLDAILTELTHVNGRLGKVEEWKAGHDKQDDERETRHEHVHGGIHEELARARDGMQAVRNELTLAAVRATVKPRGG